MSARCSSRRSTCSNSSHYRLYQASALYRELKLRGHVVAARQLRVLPHEQVYSTVPGIWNLSSDQGNLGTFVVTNVRLVWYADVNEMFNISLPYMQIAAVSTETPRWRHILMLINIFGSDPRPRL